MSNISKQDLVIIVSAAIKMAQEDNQVMPEEVAFLKKLMKKTGVKPDQVIKTKGDFVQVAAMLSSPHAKKLFLLCLAAIAKADDVVEKEEAEYFNGLAKALGVGGIDLELHSAAVLEKMVMERIPAL